MQSSILTRLYHTYLEDQDTARFIRAVATQYENATLSVLAKRGDVPQRRAAILALGYLGDYRCNSVISEALRDDDRGVRMAAESGIRNVWLSAATIGQRRQLLIAERQIGADQFREALMVTKGLREANPDFAENYRIQGIAHFGIGKISHARQDFEAALKLNPYQYQAAIGLGNCFIRSMDAVAALKQFQRALWINPNLDLVRAHVARLAKALEQS